MEINNKKDIIKRIKELEDIPLFDVKGGKQRNNQENEELIKMKIALKNLEQMTNTP